MATNQKPDDVAAILIWTRFSLVNKNISPGGWQIGRGVGTKDYIRSVVEDERRLRPRAEIFFRHTLPNIDAACRTNPAIRHVVAASDGLPGWLLGRLDEASGAFAWLHVHKVGYEDDWDWRAALRPALHSIDRHGSTDSFLVASCRLDDDDVLAPAFFQALIEYIKPPYKGFCVSFTRGYCGLWDEEASKYEAFFTWKFPMNAMGIAYIGEYDVESLQWRTPHWALPGAHENVDERVPTILDGRQRLFIRSLHGSNDVDIDVPGASGARLFLLQRLFTRASRDKVYRILKKSQPADIREIRDTFLTI